MQQQNYSAHASAYADGRTFAMLDNIKQAIAQAWTDGNNTGIETGEQEYGDKVFIEDYQSYFAIPQDLKIQVVAEIRKRLEAEQRENTATGDGIF